jgi:hypothetical protein
MNRFFITLLAIVFIFCMAPRAEAAPVWLACQATGESGAVSLRIDFDEATGAAHAVMGSTSFVGDHVSITPTSVSFQFMGERAHVRVGITRTNGAFYYGSSYYRGYPENAWVAIPASSGQCSVTSPPTTAF